jgi:hypothetical protein
MKFEILIFEQQMKRDVNYLFIYIIQIINEIHPYEIIHLWTYSSI